VLNTPAPQAPAISQNAPAAPIPLRPQPAASNAAGSPTQAEPTQRRCALEIANMPLYSTGRVTGFLSEEEALVRTKAVEARLRAQVSPGYLSLRHVTVKEYPQGGFTTMAAIPEQMVVQIGDVVELNGRYRDPSLPCHFIPWTITRLPGHAE
jgi:hypothetical protein